MYFQSLFILKQYLIYYTFTNSINVRYAVSHNSLREVCRLFGVRVSHGYTVIGKVIEFLIDYSPNVITFPTNTLDKEILAAKLFKVSAFQFHDQLCNISYNGEKIHLQQCGMHDTLGCMENIYISTKKIFSYQANDKAYTIQAICDANMRFLDVFTANGSIDVANVFHMSSVPERLDQFCEGRFHILAGSVCEIREWVITPFRCDEHLQEGTANFNRKLRETRGIVRRTFRLLFKRFPQLNRIGHMVDLKRIINFIVSCCVLHNLSIDETYINDGNHDEVSEGDSIDKVDEVNNIDVVDDEDDDFVLDTSENVLLRVKGEEKRQRIFQTFVNTL